MLIHRLIFICSLIPLFAAPASAQEATLVVENGRVIVGDGTVLDPGWVAVSGDRILSITDEPVDAPEARWIDADGKTVLPGLFDAHVHLLVDDPSSVPWSAAELDAQVRDDLPARLRAYLEAGITTVVSTGDFWPALRRVRERIRTGQLAGPRVFTSGPVFTAPGGHPAVTICGGPDGWGDRNPWCRDHLAVEVDTREAARDAVERLAREDVDLIKMVYDSISPPDVEQLETDVLREIVATAHDHGLRAYAHINEVGHTVTAVEAGLDGLVHTPFRVSREGERQALAEAMEEEGVTAATTAMVLKTLRDQFHGQGNKELAEWFEGNLQGSFETIRRIAEADASLVVLGTDTPQLAPAEAFHGEVRLLQETGLSASEIIQAATRNAAVHLGREDHLGTLETGMLADLIVVDGNPLEKLSALRSVEVVVKHGEVVISR